MTDAPILILEQDLFFVAKIRETLKAAGRVGVVVKSLAALQARLVEEPQPALVLVHFGVTALPWEAAIQAAQAQGISVLAFGSHVDIAAQRAARATGATRIIPNSKLAADLIGQIDRTLARATTDA